MDVATTAPNIHYAGKILARKIRKDAASLRNALILSEALYSSLRLGLRVIAAAEQAWNLFGNLGGNKMSEQVDKQCENCADLFCERRDMNEI